LKIFRLQAEIPLGFVTSGLIGPQKPACLAYPLERRKAALKAGGFYAGLARAQAGSKGVAMFDEVALSNDLAARTGEAVPARAGAEQTSEAGGANLKTCPTVQRRSGSEP